MGIKKSSMAPPFNYRREELVYVPEQYQILLMTWFPGSKTKPHNHGVSQGIVIVLAGRVYQRVFDSETRKFLFQKEYDPGDELKEYPDTIHEMGNVLKTKNSVTQHTYWPPLESMCLFEDLRKPRIRIWHRSKSEHDL